MPAVTPVHKPLPFGQRAQNGAANAAHPHLSSSLLAEMSASDSEKHAGAVEHRSQES